MPRRRFDDAPRDLAVRLFRDAHAAERIASMGIESGRQQDRLRLVVVDGAHDHVFDAAEIRGIAEALRERNVERVAAAFAFTDFVRRAGTRIKRKAVHRRIEDIVPIPEQCLRSIAVMNVEIEDEHALDAGLLAHPLGHASDRVEETETHRLEAFGVMSRRTRHDEGAAVFRFHHFFRSRERRADRRARGRERLRRHRIVARHEIAQPGPRGLLQRAFVVSRMHLRNDPIGIRMIAGVAAHARNEPGTLDARKRRVHPPRRLRMPGAGVVLVEDGVRVDVEHVVRRSVD